MRIKKVLVVNTIHIPSYFNAGHHLPIFYVGEYIRKNNKHINVECKDLGVLNCTWKDFSHILYQGQYDLISIMLDFDTADNIERMIYYIKSILPKSLILLFGRMCKINPNIFRKYKIDGVVVDGDDEYALNSFVDYKNGINEKPLGCLYRENGEWHESIKGCFLKPEEWVFPRIEEIPYSSYSQLYMDDSNKFCGIPNKKELVVNVSRGCPINCKYCDVVKVQGIKDRRISAEKLYNFIRDNFYKYEFDYVSMFSAIFTLDNNWVRQFTKLMKKEKIPWKCVTTIEHITSELLVEMAEANCIRISIGVENITSNNNELPSIKNNTKEKIIEINRICKEYNIELNCFVMIGIPNISCKENMDTIKILEELDVRIRPTVYTRYDVMASEKDVSKLYKYNRQILDTQVWDNHEMNTLYEIIHGSRLKNTEIYKKF